MSAFVDLTGQKFGRLTVIKRNKNNNGVNWFCRCKCGNNTVIPTGHLKSGHTSSCGCFLIEQRRICNIKHGMRRTQIYYIWCSMHERCYNSNSKGYSNYGGRGIKVCKRWYKFENFFADMGKRPKNKTIERKDNNGNYTPKNCIWASRRKQSNNQRSNVLITFQGKTRTIAQWARKIGVTYHTLYLRIKRRNWPIEKALTIT